MNDLNFFANLVTKANWTEAATKTLMEVVDNNAKVLGKAIKMTGACFIILGVAGLLQNRELRKANYKITALEKRLAALEYQDCKPKEHKEDESNEFLF